MLARVGRFAGAGGVSARHLVRDTIAACKRLEPGFEASIAALEKLVESPDEIIRLKAAKALYAIRVQLGQQAIAASTSGMDAIDTEGEDNTAPEAPLRLVRESAVTDELRARRAAELVARRGNGHGTNGHGTNGHGG